MNELVSGSRRDRGRTEDVWVARRWPDRAERQGTWVHEATEATPEMAAYFLGALRDQSSRAGAFRRQLRWERLRQTLTSEEAAVAEQHLLEARLVVLRPELTTSEARPEPPQAVAG
jgi:hypothetical protein